MSTRKKFRPSPQPEWESPRVPQSPDAIKPPAKQSILERAEAMARLGTPPEVLAAIIIAQAAEDLGKKLIEAAAIGRNRGT